MIYSILKFLSRLTIWGYFRKVKIVGKEYVPEDGPYIFVANHPSAFMDPIVVATSVKPSIHFIAAGEYVGKGLKGWIFQKVLHMIPVYRPSTRPEEAHKNKDMFLKCHDHLEEGGALLIFPEGVSLTEKKLKPLKTGTIRIALGAELKNGFNLHIPIIPIGLNYSDPHQFRSDLFVKIAEPLYIRDFMPAELSSFQLTEQEEIDLTRHVTEQLEKHMQRTILHIDTEDDEALLTKLNAVFSSEVKRQFDIDYSDQEGEFDMQKDFLKAIHYYKKADYSAFNETLLNVDEYLDLLQKNGLTDKDIGEFRRRHQFRRITTFLLGLPLFLIGLVTNFIPYRGVGTITNRIKLDATFQGSVALAIGLFLFLFWYIGLAITFGTLWIGWYAVFLPIIFYTSGLYALVYKTAISHSIARRRLRHIFAQNKDLIKSLMKKRAIIVNTIEKVQTEYLAQKTVN